MKSPCHNTEMYGGAEMQCCPICGKWYKTQELKHPLLDGGQIVYQLAEWFKGEPLSERAMVIGQQIGIFFVIALTGFAFYNDIVRLFGS